MKKVIIAVALAALAAPASAKWAFSSDIDPMTDAKNEYVTNSEDNIGFSCDFALLSFGKYMNSNGTETTVTIRIDKNPAIYASGTWFTAGAVIKNDELISKKIIEQMKKGSKVVYRASDYQGGLTTKRASLAGFTKAYNQLNCK